MRAHRKPVSADARGTTWNLPGAPRRVALLRERDEPAALAALSAAGARAGVTRIVDIVGATVLIILCMPLFLVLAVAIKLDSPGAVVFAHRRLGRNGRHFDCLKFRSMCAEAERLLQSDEKLRHDYVSNHFKIPTDCDPRITRLGRFLRKSSLDELPQLFNVIRGDMSLVGPRPIVPLEATHYGERLPVLLAVRPGLTGPWAVQGRSRVGYPERADMELKYVSTWTFLSDMRILARTPWAVVSQRGAL
jgi:lipopolysaccharide/colanic/teichoic acid biosynthesis glycosyltransferase